MTWACFESVMFAAASICRYRSLAGVCCRVLRLDLLLLAAHQLHALSSVSHLCEEEDVMEVGGEEEGRVGGGGQGEWWVAKGRWIGMHTLLSSWPSMHMLKQCQHV